MKRALPLLLGAIVASGLITSNARAVVLGSYTPDGNTLALYSFDEASGTYDNEASAATDLDLTNTGGASGRNGGGGGYGGTSYTGFGSSYYAFGAGSGSHSTSANGPGGGASTSAAVPQSSLQGADGAFTYEAIVNLASVPTSAEQTILSHDGFGTRGFLFRVVNVSGTYTLSFFNGTSSITQALPGAGDHAFNTTSWFHVAVTYNGQVNGGNLNFYWTAMDTDATQANLLHSTTMNNLPSAASNLFGVGTTTRQPYRFEAEYVDEVRISNIARTADQFLFAVPEPGVASLLAIAGVGALTLRRRRS